MEFEIHRAVPRDFAGIIFAMIFSRRNPRDLSAKAGLRDRVPFPRLPGSGALRAATAIVRMTAREGAVSQLRRIVILEGPSLPRGAGRALLHHQLLLAFRDRQAFVAATVPDMISLEAKVRGDLRSDLNQGPRT